jgi:glutaredoxin
MTSTRIGEIDLADYGIAPPAAYPAVTVYSRSQCPGCRVAKDALRRKGVEHVVVDCDEALLCEDDERVRDGCRAWLRQLVAAASSPGTDKNRPPQFPFIFHGPGLYYSTLDVMFDRDF